MADMASRPVRIPERLAVEVEGLAKGQHRSFANMVAHLLRVGLKAERGPAGDELRVYVNPGEAGLGEPRYTEP